MKRKLAVVAVAFAALTVGFGAAPAHAVHVSDHIDVSDIAPVNPIQVDLDLDTKGAASGLVNICLSGHLVPIAHTCISI
jgi:hypothetical protein